MYYEDNGEGEPLVLIPGLSVDHLAWVQLQVPALVAAGYRCVSIDNRDVGQTDSSPGARYTIRQMADDTVGLMTRLGVEPAHILGWSMGGMIAQELAINYPARVRSVTLYSTDAGQNPWGNAWLATMMMLRPKCSLREFAQLAGTWIFAAEFFAQPGAEEAFLDMVSTNPFPQTPEAFARQCQAILAHDAADRLSSISAPAHVIVGEKDILTPPHRSQLIAERIPGATLTLVPRAGHAAGWENPSVFNDQVITFMKQHEALGPA